MDDHVGMREGVAAVLMASGYEVQTCNNGREGLTCIQETCLDFDLLISDIRMPVMDGIEMVRRLNETNFKGPIILFSSFGASLQEAEAIGPRINAKVQKGDVQVLLDAIAAVLA